MLTIEQTLEEIDRQIVQAENLADEILSAKGGIGKEDRRSLDNFFMASGVLKKLKATIWEG
jgi:hypothetical protein